MTHINYLHRRDRLLKSFDNSISRVRPWIFSHLDEPQAELLIQDAHEQYEELIPKIPYIGNRNPLLIFLHPTAQYLAVYRAFQKQGLTIEEAGELILKIGAENIIAIPPIIRRLIGFLWFSRMFRSRLMRRAEMSEERRYPGDYVLTYVPGDGREFDYGIDYLECASCKMLKAENAMELAPYVCAVDKSASELLGWGLTRTMTLAAGFDKCDFRFKKGGETHVELQAEGSAGR